jgi:hypothetical protein
MRMQQGRDALHEHEQIDDEALQQHVMDRVTDA